MQTKWMDRASKYKISEAEGFLSILYVLRKLHKGNDENDERSQVSSQPYIIHQRRRNFFMPFHSDN